MNKCIFCIYKRIRQEVRQDMNGAEAMVACLKAEGITKIFGIPGVAIAPFYEALYNQNDS